MFATKLKMLGSLQAEVEANDGQIKDTRKRLQYEDVKNKNADGHFHEMLVQKDDRRFELIQKMEEDIKDRNTKIVRQAQQMVACEDRLEEKDFGMTNMKEKAETHGQHVPAAMEPLMLQPQGKVWMCGPAFRSRAVAHA